MSSPIRTKKKLSPIAIGILYGILTLVVVVSTHFVLQGYTHAFKSSPRSGTITEWKSAGAHRTRYDSYPIYDYIIKGTDGRMYTISHTKESYETGQTLTFYVPPGSSEGHVGWGWPAFFSGDAQRTGTSYVLFALLFLLVSLPIWVSSTMSIVLSLLKRRA